MNSTTRVPRTTLCCVDCVYHDLAAIAMLRSMERCAFDRAVMITDRAASLPGIEVVTIPPLRSREDYSRFVVKDLHRYIDTDFVLLVQWDGYVVHPESWTDAFLEWDYIGARWVFEQGPHRVGNGGFSLRSRRLLQALTDPRIELTDTEDIVICRTQRPLLEREHGIRFAPEDVADAFAFETGYPVNKPFGFHGLFNMWMLVRPDELAAFLSMIPRAVVLSPPFLSLGRNYADLGRVDEARKVLGMILEADPGAAEAAAILRRLSGSPAARSEADRSPGSPAAPAPAQRPSGPAFGAGTATRRNDPCPCGSGLRFKSCHGRFAAEDDSSPATTIAGTAQRPASGPPRADDVPALLESAQRAHSAGRLYDAESLYARVLLLQPENAMATHYLGVLAWQRGDLVSAERRMRAALASDAHPPEFHNNLGLVLQTAALLEDAAAAFREALARAPNYPQAHTNLGFTLLIAGDAAGALPHLERAVALDPALAEAHWNLALGLLLVGDLARGWREYEWRLHLPSLGGRDPAPVPAPPWRGEPLRGRRLLVWAEQGAGDFLQMARLLPRLAADGAQVSVLCGPALAGLVSRVEGVARVVRPGEPLPAFDAQCPVMSLPLYLGIDSLDAIPADVPYLAADPQRSAAWASRLAPWAGTLRVGIAWAGNPENPHNRYRSCTLEDLAPLGRIPGVTLFGLQKGPGADQASRPPAGMPFVDLGPDLADFDDTAAAMQAMDLIVTIDTSVAHLAGALGRPLWVLLCHGPDWRWHPGRTPNPWYPAARLFRQPQRGAWGPVVAEASRELARLAASRPA